MEPLDRQLYEHVKQKADNIFPSKSGVYRSSWIIREYKKLGGRFMGSKPKNTGLSRWYNEKWVDLNRPIKDSKGKVIGYEPCGRKSMKGKYPLCRPSIRVTSSTPLTYQEFSTKIINKAKELKILVKDKGNIRFEGGVRQYYGKPSQIMVKVPKSVAECASYAFKLRDMGFLGGVETGWLRAQQLSTQIEIPVEDVRYMHAWFKRHIFTSYPGYKMWHQAGRPLNKIWHKKRSIIAWLIWGGDPALEWLNSDRILDMLSKNFDKTFTRI